MGARDAPSTNGSRATPCATMRRARKNSRRCVHPAAPGAGSTVPVPYAHRAGMGARGAPSTNGSRATPCATLWSMRVSTEVGALGRKEKIAAWAVGRDSSSKGSATLA
ncbi:Uncharacterized protein Fot_12193 [Forsythia ovata]|uniref:Uncharacterized protein n=1 Tax=Forsythia ovata TaxID=205694 RepID=A0ABD1WLU8_9LAMI